ncbi:site-specific tyrosine recombinase XerD [Mycetocola reblochoni]|uniref:Tyrosine recombinase XerD n=2 Tax=Mycetocola reblochoni TaxID=331618 RepID=A0A1R4IZH2_9MICO|nr:site-specific tyrosine recombinase XerD [Mycetocola reblochoni]RLP68804.1 site-specific tyrosine recombinase XerD [Mycetocola reblochoni]SJN25237.1 Tyrosine recombinase XerC [Mycetocola reblochoni REB411]
MQARTELDRYLRHITVERGLSPHTVSAYRRDLGGYVDWLAGEGVEELGAVSAEQVERFLASRATGAAPLAPSSRARLLSAVRGLHRFVSEEDPAAPDPSERVRPPSQPSRLPHPLSHDQVSALLAAVEPVADSPDPVRLRDRALLELLYATGARISEAVALDVDDLADGELLRLLGKGRKERIVPVGSYARAAMDEYLVRGRPALAASAREPAAVFLGQRGQRLSRQSAWLVIRAAAERAGIADEVSPHTLRHSFATHLLQGGADVRVVQELLGHSSVATTQIYTLVTADALRDMYSTAHPRARS